LPETLISTPLEFLIPFVIIDSASLPVTQNVVGFGNEFELFFGTGVFWVAIGVISQSELPEAALDFPQAGALPEAENTIVIALLHAHIPS
jgi:hypothetical protein